MDFPNRNAVAIGEAMIEMAPVGDGLYRRGFAGDTFNTVWHLAQLMGGAGAAGFATRVGRDALSEAFVREIAADGLDVSAITRDNARTMGLYLIELDGVERSFHYWRRDSAARMLAEDAEALAASVAGAGLIHLSGISLAILAPDARTRLFEALVVARAAGARVSFDPNIRPRLWSSTREVRETVARALAVTDIALPSFDDETPVWGDRSPEHTVGRLRDAGVAEIVVKDGARPVFHHADGRTGQRATPAVADIRDTTGAGDAFNAGYLAARLLGHGADASVAEGQRISGAVIGHFGARMPRAALSPIAPAPDGAG